MALGARPRLAAKARLRVDRLTGRTVLLYPERGLALNHTAAAILALCSGERTVEDIVERMAAGVRGRERPLVTTEVRAFLAALVDRGLLVER